MTEIGTAAAIAVGGYLLGSVSFARIVAKLSRGGDLPGRDRLAWGEDEAFEVDNVSATSVRQARGPALGCVTGIFDILKAFVPVLALRLAFPDTAYAAVCAAAVMAGHNYPIFHRFRGGRGTSTLIGGLLVLSPLAIPVTIVAGYAIGLYVFRDVLLAHHAGWILLLPVWFAAFGQWDLVVFALVINVLRWSVSVPELRQWWDYRRTGELRTREFHEAVEQTHIGYIHGWLRRRGWIRYDYMEAD
jgi:glycerol-3-phosphate acyltransferase PlsY